LEYEIQVTVNGEKYQKNVLNGATLLNFLRDELGLNGTKNGCEEGACGSCTVIVDNEPLKSCAVLAKNFDGADIETIENLASNDFQENNLHPLQAAFLEEGAVQCGYCTPGMIMTAKAFLNRNPNPTEAEIKAAINANICRCTGYKKIIEAIKKAAKTYAVK